jgi:alkanesulfonate monooxygenase SsuD/methylene tetrahydromethanopterin reductase-like flavin-dependent oxidoreductase (luciferase family)
MCTAEETDELVRFTRLEAGDRTVEWNVLVQVVKVTDDRRAVAEELARKDDETLSAAEILATPFLLIGTVDEIAAQILRNRDRYGSPTTRCTSRSPRN